MDRSGHVLRSTWNLGITPLWRTKRVADMLTFRMRPSNIGSWIRSALRGSPPQPPSLRAWSLPPAAAQCTNVKKRNCEDKTNWQLLHLLLNQNPILFLKMRNSVQKHQPNADLQCQESTHTHTETVAWWTKVYFQSGWAHESSAAINRLWGVWPLHLICGTHLQGGVSTKMPLGMRRLGIVGVQHSPTGHNPPAEKVLLQLLIAAILFRLHCLQFRGQTSPWPRPQVETTRNSPWLKFDLTSSFLVISLWLIWNIVM